MTNQKPAQTTAAAKIIQKSRTLYNSTIKAPAKQGVMMARKAGRSMDIARSKNISKFAPPPVVKSNNTKSTPDIQPVRHPLAQKVDSIRNFRQAQIQPRTSQQIKQAAINDAMNQLSPQPTKVGFFKRHFKFVNIVIASILVIIVSGVLVYFNMPSISVGVINMQSGAKATFPEYHPDGYSINGPASYDNNTVTINFRANTGDKKFTIKQTKSTWDSSAVRNKVNKDSGGEFITTEEKGLTIYTHNGNAAWVNGGILYTIEGNAPLSGDQIRRIATSL
ncbi:MAG: hypothetical protein WCP11_03280 [Candidatus Saccharibacteria bacterium]